MKKGIILFLLITLLLPCVASAQYNDHRDHYHTLDSLEHVLATTRL